MIEVIIFTHIYNISIFNLLDSDVLNISYEELLDRTMSLMTTKLKTTKDEESFIQFLKTSTKMLETQLNSNNFGYIENTMANSKPGISMNIGLKNNFAFSSADCQGNFARKDLTFLLDLMSSNKERALNPAIRFAISPSVQKILSSRASDHKATLIKKSGSRKDPLNILNQKWFF